MDDTGYSGFTLVELLLTLAIAALLAGVAVPAMGRYVDNARLHAATESVVRQLRLARNHTLTHHRAVSVSLAASARNWCFGWRDTGPCNCHATDTADDACRNGDSAQASVHRLDAEDFPAVNLALPRGAATWTMHFSPPRGMASAASFGFSNPHRELRVIVSPLGRVRVCAPDADGAPAC